MDRDGAAPHDGYDWASSDGGGTLVDQACTFGATNLGALAPTWVINEVNADPDTSLVGDANGDGVSNFSDDEFVELVNVSGGAQDISGWTLSDGVSIRHTFPSGRDSARASTASDASATMPCISATTRPAALLNGSTRPGSGSNGSPGSGRPLTTS